MKLKITILFLSIYAFTFSQTDNVSYKDLGIQKKPVKIESMTYSMEDKFITDSRYGEPYYHISYMLDNGEVVVEDVSAQEYYRTRTGQIFYFSRSKWHWK